MKILCTILIVLLGAALPLSLWADANFPCGAVMKDETGELYLYYGAADTCMALATAKMKDVLDFLKYDG